MKLLLALLLLAAPSFAQTTFAGPCSPPRYSSTTSETSYYCYSMKTYDEAQVWTGYLAFQVTLNPDASFSDGMVTVFDTADQVTLTSTDWAGSDFDGPLNFTDASGNVYPASLSVVVYSYVHKEGGGRVGIRYVTSWAARDGLLTFD